LQVAHGRIRQGLGVDEVDIEIQLETRGAEHCAELLGSLRSSGYVVHSI
jgi:threonine dehydratase